MPGRIVTNEQTGEKAWWDGQTLRPLRDDEIAAGQGGPQGPVMGDVVEDRKRLSNLRDRADKSLYAATQAEQFMANNKEAGTGGILGLGLPWNGGSVGDIMAAFNPKLAAMKAITSRVAPQNRVTGSGSSSDKDVEMQVSGFPNIKTPGPANAENALQWKSQAAQDAAHSAFMDRYMAVHGTMLGGEQAFSGWWASQGSKKYGVDALSAKPAGGFKYLGPEN